MQQTEFDVRCEWEESGVVTLAAFDCFKDNLLGVLRECSSGKELIEMGFDEDILASAALDADNCAPILKDGEYKNE